MLTLLIGRSGSGKTQKITDAILEHVNKNERTYLIVPEQQLYITECMLASLPPSSALCFEVVSFSRLSDIIFEKYGGLTERAASNALRNLIMWHTLRDVLKNKSENDGVKLEQYDKIKADSSITSTMLATIDELKASSISSEKFAELADKLQGTHVAKKVSDISKIYTEFEKNLSKRVGESKAAAEKKLVRAAEKLREKNFFSGSHVYIDSFTSFTGEEYAMLRSIIAQAKSTTVALTCVSGSKAPHFLSVSNTIDKLYAIAEKDLITVSEIKLDKYTRSDKEELAILEKHLWDFSLSGKSLPKIKNPSDGCIETYKCNNEYDEIWLAGLNVMRAREKGINFSEIAVITRNPETRRGAIDSIFDRLGIPYFFSERTDLSTTAPARLILSALRCVAHDFRAVDVITLLKTGLLPISELDADHFEDYCYTWNINGSRFTESAWSMNPDGHSPQMSKRARVILESANKVRKEIIEPLEQLRTAFSISGNDTKEVCRALYGYLNEVGLSKTLVSRAHEALKDKNGLREAGELVRLNDYIISVLTDIATVFDDTQMSAEELYTAIEIMLKNTDIGSIPPIVDCVTVGSAATLRLENIKVAILVGLCEGEFPANYSDSSILTESDKSAMDDAMKELNISIDSRERTVTADELFYVYRAMTKPSEQLILSTCASTVSGKKLKSSTAWDRVHFLFPDLEIKQFDLSRIRQIASHGTDDRAADKKANESTTIDPDYVRSLFPDVLSLSKSKINSFVGCPFKYWCEEILKLREQKISQINYADSGDVIHHVLEHSLKELKDKDTGRLEVKTDAELIGLVDKHLTEYINSLTCPLPASTMYTFSRLRDFSLIMLKNITEEFNSSEFVPIAFEQKISLDGEDDLRPIKIRVFEAPNSPTVVLNGTIDRIDCYTDGDKKYLRIIDYKTGTHSFDAEKMNNGEDLQLPAYLFTATLEQNKAFFNSEERPVAAGAQFFSANEKEGGINISRSGFMLFDEKVLEAANKDLDPKITCIKLEKDKTTKSRSAMSESEIEAIDETMRNTISSTARNLYSGNAPKTPSKDACTFCTLRSRCPVAYKGR
ncbi:MAG: PD-(D/E)XK nuclease family protein [Clostridia bacterium]|nr:PD-(D/E)XK nuclease family protein [Clostridia bacterium]